MRQLLLTLVLVPLCACAPLTVQAAKPRPNIALSAQDHALTLKLGNEVEDQTLIPPQQGIPKLQVNEWHKTLEAGFKSGLSGSFSGGAPWVLNIERAELVLMPTLLVGGRVHTVHAQLTYRARLIDDQGKEVAMSAAAVESKTTASSPTSVEMTRLAGDAVEVMYEHLSGELFAK